MATVTVTFAKATAGNPPSQPGAALRRIAQGLLNIAQEAGDQGLTGASVTLVVDNAPASGAVASFAIAGGPFAATRSFEING